jgi:ribosome-associated protein
MTEPTPVAIRGEQIRLGQFLKLADAVDQGGDVKALLATRAVSVNGEIEVRRGRQLSVGDVVGVGYVAYTVSSNLS